MKKRRLRKGFKVLFILLIFIGLFLVFKNIFSDSNDINDDINYVDSVYSKLDDIDKDFLNWVNSSYEGSLEKLDKLLDNGYDESYWHDVTGYSYIVLNDLYNNRYDKMDNIKIVDSDESGIISIVGDVSLADNWYIAPKYDEGGISRILSSDMLEMMNSSDVMIVNSEFTVSNRGNKIPNKMYTFRAKPERLSIYDEMGVDLVTLANNHVYDYGSDAFNDMLDAFDNYNIPHIGAGHNKEEASKPYYFVVNGYKIAFVNANRSEKVILTPGATDDNEGVFRCYDPTDMVNLIKSLRDSTDYIIAIIHYGRENSHELEEEQISSSKLYIDAGADMVVGHHAHTLQGIEFYNHKPIIYNLGNFLFNDQEIETALFKVVINDGVLEYYMVPALQKNEFTDILSGSRGLDVLNDITSYSVNAYIDEDGKIMEK